MFRWLENWALKRLLKRFAKTLPIAQDRINELWEEHKEEIFERVIEAIKKTITNILKKVLEKQGVKLTEN